MALAGAFCCGRWKTEARSPKTGDRLPKPPARFWWLLASVPGLYSHVFLDYLNNYGVRLLTPLDWRWFYGDAVFIVDPWLWVTLGLGVWFARRRARPRRRSSPWASPASTWPACWSLAHDARRFVIASGGRARGQPPRALMVGPVPIVPWSREVIIDAGDAYRVGLYTVWPRRLQLTEELIPKNDRLPAVAAARDEPRVAAFLVWSRFPFWELMPSASGTVATVRDVRFRQRVAGTFNATAIVREGPQTPARSAGNQTPD